MRISEVQALTLLKGYPMAKNLRAKIPKTDTLVISDLNVDATKNFIKEVGNDTRTEIAQSVREIAEKSVSASLTPRAFNLVII